MFEICEMQKLHDIEKTSRGSTVRFILSRFRRKVGLSELERRMLDLIVRYYNANKCEMFTVSYLVSALGQANQDEVERDLRKMVKKGFLRYEGIHENEQLYALEQRGFEISDEPVTW